jgi:hypothetical protein
MMYDYRVYSASQGAFLIVAGNSGGALRHAVSTSPG